MALTLLAIWNTRWSILKVCASVFLLANKETSPLFLIAMLLWTLKKKWTFVSEWAAFIYNLAVSVLKFIWAVYYWISGIFIFHYIYKGVAGMIEAQQKEARNWDVKRVGGISRMYNRVTGQTIEEEYDVPAQRPLRPAIPTWLHCAIYDNQNIPQHAHKGRRFVAHVDTGNSASTTIAKRTFEAMHPGGLGAVYKGSQTIRGVTGERKTCPVYEIQYQLHGVVGPNCRPLKVTVDAIILDDNFLFDILISTKDMQIFCDTYHYVIKPVTYETFSARQN
jgi:hypothetical protein